MAGTLAQGATFTFKGSRFTITSISVDSPTAEVADMTAWNAAASQSVIAPTGSWSGGNVTVEFLRTPATPDLSPLVTKVGALAFSSPGFSYSRNVLLESYSEGAKVGDLVRGTAKFRLTDYYPTS